jgi:hypothetical protein
MYPSKDIAGEVSKIVAVLEPWIVSLSTITWKPNDGGLPLVYRGVLRRQFDCLQCILLLVENDRGYGGVPLLRAACEELLWVKYLKKLDPQDAEEIVMLMVGSELGDSLAAQAAYSGFKAMEFIGLGEHLKRITASRPQVVEALQTLGKKLNWPKKAIESGRLPSVAFIARAVGMKKEYDFLYHGSSRYVHFSVAELLRRAWGKSGAVTVDSSHFTDYWGAFAAFWGIKLFFEAYNEIDDLLDSAEHIPDDEAESILDAAKRLGEIGQVPLVTAQELAWDTERWPG